MRDAIRNNTGDIEGMDFGQYIWPIYIYIYIYTYIYIAYMLYMY